MSHILIKSRFFEELANKMKFPSSIRVRYEKNPLLQVICQLQFPKTLRIQTELPVAFQEGVRNDYPHLQTTQSLLRISLERQAEPPHVAEQERAYEFRSGDTAWKLVLASDFLALSTTRYTRWEEFRSRLESAVTLLGDIYRPPHFTRIGLRYQNVITRSLLALGDCQWPQLLSHPLAGILVDEAVLQHDVLEMLSIFSCRLDYENAIVRVRHGLARQARSEEVGYLIDSDFFSEGTIEVGNALSRLDSFNREAGRFFRWCISEELHNAMDPVPIDPAS